MDPTSDQTPSATTVQAWPTARTVSRWLKRFTMKRVEHLMALNAAVVAHIQPRLQLGSLTIDVDGTARAARAYARGEVMEGFVAHVPDDVDVRAVRKKLSLTREAFAQRFGLSADAVKEWEMGRRKPERATRVLLRVIDREPEAVKRALEIA